ncbi:hypothetical protein ACRCPS_17555 [Pseudomonas aeruginosa]
MIKQAVSPAKGLILAMAAMMLASGQALASPRSCSDAEAKQAVFKAAERTRGNYVKLLQKQGREAWAKVTEVYQIETLRKDAGTGRVECFAKAKIESNWGALAQPVWATYTLGNYDDGTAYSDVHVLSADERQRFSRGR